MSQRSRCNFISYSNYFAASLILSFLEKRFSLVQRCGVHNPSLRLCQRRAGLMHIAYWTANTLFVLLSTRFCCRPRLAFEVSGHKKRNCFICLPLGHRGRPSYKNWSVDFHILPINSCQASTVAIIHDCQFSIGSHSSQRCAMNYSVFIIVYPFLALLGLFFWFAITTWRTYLTFDLAKIPSPPCDLLTGHLQKLQQPNFHRILSSWSSQYGPIFRCKCELLLKAQSLSA